MKEVTTLQTTVFRTYDEDELDRPDDRCSAPVSYDGNEI